jgi:hypothetical protein
MLTFNSSSLDCFIKFPKGKKMKVWKMAHYLTKLIRQLKKLYFYYEKPGHFVKNCLKKKSDEKEKANRASED